MKVVGRAERWQGEEHRRGQRRVGRVRVYCMSQNLAICQSIGFVIHVSVTLLYVCIFLYIFGSLAMRNTRTATNIHVNFSFNHRPI